MSNKNKGGGLVYSTNPGFRREEENEGRETPAPGDQLLMLHRETKGRGGKAVVIVRGFEGSNDELETLGKKLKAHCGTGGSVKDGEIIIQGDQREKVSAFLKAAGYKVKHVGG